MNRTRSAMLLLALLSLAGAADTAHITDKLAVGLYEAAEDGTEPVRVLISGTPVEILQRNGRFCEVRLGDGTEGWLECRYASDEKPARTMLLEAQARSGELRERVAELERQLEEKQLRLQELELRMQAAERMVEGQGVNGVSTETVNVLGAGEGDRIGGPGAGSDFVGLWPALSGAGGFILGALLLWWRCRRRSGGWRV